MLSFSHCELLILIIPCKCCFARYNYSDNFAILAKYYLLSWIISEFYLLLFINGNSLLFWTYLTWIIFSFYAIIFGINVALSLSCLDFLYRILILSSYWLSMTILRSYSTIFLFRPPKSWSLLRSSSFSLFKKLAFCS